MPEHTIAENLSRLITAKTDIANAITTMGGVVGENDGFEEFPADILSIPSGGDILDDIGSYQIWSGGAARIDAAALSTPYLGVQPPNISTTNMYINSPTFLPILGGYAVLCIPAGTIASGSSISAGTSIPCAFSMFTASNTNVATYDHFTTDLNPVYAYIQGFNENSGYFKVDDTVSPTIYRRIQPNSTSYTNIIVSIPCIALKAMSANRGIPGNFILVLFEFK